MMLSQAIESFERDGSEIACRAGCSFCCPLRVMVYAHEAIALIRNPALLRRWRSGRDLLQGVRGSIA
ncbi:MAG: hypothetical protein WDO56_17985 [Gammaproteobacteria bacterium]